MARVKKQISSMYAKGMTTRQISATLEDIDKRIETDFLQPKIVGIILPSLFVLLFIIYHTFLPKGEFHMAV